MATNSIVDLSQLSLKKMVRKIKEEEADKMLKIITENNTKILELQNILVMLMRKEEVKKQEEQRRREQREMRRREYDEKWEKEKQRRRKEREEEKERKRIDNEQRGVDGMR